MAAFSFDPDWMITVQDRKAGKPAVVRAFSTARANPGPGCEGPG